MFKPVHVYFKIICWLEQFKKMSSTINFSKRTLVVITGASRGIGRTIALEISQRLGKESKIILIARSADRLNATKQEIIARNTGISVSVCSLDLSKATIKHYEEIFKENIQDTERYDLSIIFHNAGQIGALKDTTELTDLVEWVDYYNLNMFSIALLNSVFIKQSKKIADRIAVINISSLCGHKPFVNMALYGSVKAARDLFFSVLAIEDKDITVLKYCPGPVDTAMIKEVISNAENEEVRMLFQEIKESTILTPEQTVQKLMRILENGQFKSGDLIDYYDP